MARDRTFYDVFISYSRRDNTDEFVSTLLKTLEEQNFRVWMDTTDIPPAFNWEKEIYLAIESANSFIFILSPDSSASEWCHKELAYAVKLHKRIIPVVRRPANPVPESLHPLNWINFRSTDDSDEAVSKILEAIRSGGEVYVRLHTQILVKALEWHNEKRNTSYLLRGNNLEDAEAWLKTSKGKEPQPTNYHHEYISISRATANRRRVMTLGAFVIFVAVVSIFGIVALLQSQNANQASSARTTQQMIANRKAAETTSITLGLASSAAFNQGKIDLALALALEANRITDAPAEAQTALIQAAYAPGAKRRFDTSPFPVTAAEFSPDGQRMAIASGHWEIVRTAQYSGGSLSLWDVSTGKKIFDFAVPDELQYLGMSNDINSLVFTALGFSRDGKFIISGSGNGRVFLWDASTGKFIRKFDDLEPLKNVPFLVSQVLFTSDNGLALVKSGEAVSATDFTPGYLFLWNTYTGKKVRQIGAINEDLTNLVLSADGTLLASSLQNAKGALTSVCLWRIPAGDKVRCFPFHDNSLRPLAFSADNHVLAIRDGDSTVRLLDLSTGTSIRTLSLDKAKIQSFWQGGATFYALSLSNDGIIHVWNLTTANEVRSLRGLTAQLNVSGFNPTGTMIFVGSGSGAANQPPTAKDIENGGSVLGPDGNEVRVWDVDPGRESITFEMPNMKNGGGFYGNDPGKVFFLASDTLEILDVKTGKVSTTTKNPFATLSAVDPFGLEALSVETPISLVGDSKLALWDVLSGKINRYINAGDQSDGIRTATFSPDGKYVATGGAKLVSGWAVVQVWNTATGATVMRDDSGDGANVLVFSPDSRYLAAGTGDVRALPSVEIYDLNGNNNKRFSLPATVGSVQNIVFSSDSRMIMYSGNTDPDLHVGDVASGTEIYRVSGFSNNASEFSKDGSTIISVSRDGTVIVLSASTGKELRRFPGYLGPVESIAFSPDYPSVLVTNRENLTRITKVPVDIADVIRWACTHRYVPEISEKDRTQYGITMTQSMCAAQTTTIISGKIPIYDAGMAGGSMDYGIGTQPNRYLTCIELQDKISTLGTLIPATVSINNGDPQNATILDGDAFRVLNIPNSSDQQNLRDPVKWIFRIDDVTSQCPLLTLK